MESTKSNKVTLPLTASVGKLAGKYGSNHKHTIISIKHTTPKLNLHMESCTFTCSFIRDLHKRHTHHHSHMSYINILYKRHTHHHSHTSYINVSDDGNKSIKKDNTTDPKEVV